MHIDRAHDDTGIDPIISTGSLPDASIVTSLLETAHARYLSVADGKVADYIPALAAASPDSFGLAIVSAAGTVFTAGDVTTEFSIQSISKPFVFALVCDALGSDIARDRVGVNSTGLPFNSVMATELSDDHTTNPMVNGGAIATTSLVPGDSAEDKWTFIREGLSAFAGRTLEIDEAVHRSESESNQRNRALARLLESYGHMYFDPLEATDIYTRQCSLLVSTVDLAVMSATLADGGVNPVTGVRVVSQETCTRVLAVLATAGLYERTGEWLYDIGLPAKSGVSGGLITVAPGKGGLATFSPPLDDAGNSVRGQLATSFLSHMLGLNLFASAPVA